MLKRVTAMNVGQLDAALLVAMKNRVGAIRIVDKDNYFQASLSVEQEAELTKIGCVVSNLPEESIVVEPGDDPKDRR